MMKYLFILLFFYISLNASSDNNSSWKLNRFNFYFENDVYAQTDDGYSAGERLSLLYFIENETYSIFKPLFLDFGETRSYFSLSLTNQIFTPTDTKTSELIISDRPYAGWTYLEAGIHKSSKIHLQSLALKIGVIGEISQSEFIQNNFHKLIGNDSANGWSNQLNNEVGINLKYIQKWILQSKSFKNFEASLVPFISAELGTIAINATTGISGRFGYNIPKDFGVSSIDIGADPGIPVFDSSKNMKKSPWSFSLNLMVATSVVAHDIFLDGNLFSNSHHVEKENYIYYFGFGFTTRYKNFIFDFIGIHNSKKYKLEKSGHGVGTMVFSWLY